MAKNDASERDALVDAEEKRMNKHIVRGAGILWLAVLLLGLAPIRRAAAADGVAVHRVEGLTAFMFHFGGGVGEAAVTSENFERFVEEVVMPRFPTGATVQEAVGQWRNPDTGEIVREKTRLLSLHCYPDAKNKAEMAEIADEYVRRHRDANASCFIRIIPGVTTELHYIGAP